MILPPLPNIDSSETRNPKQDSVNVHQQRPQQFTEKGRLNIGQGGELANTPQAGSSIDMFYFKDLDIDVAQHPPRVPDFQIDHLDDSTQCLAGIDEFEFADLLHYPSGIDEFHFNGLDNPFQAQEMVGGMQQP